MEHLSELGTIVSEMLRGVRTPEESQRLMAAYMERHADDPAIEAPCSNPNCDGHGNDCDPDRPDGQKLIPCRVCLEKSRQQAGARFAGSCGAAWSEVLTWQTARGGRETPLGSTMSWWKRHGALRCGLLLTGGVPGAGRTTALIGLGVKLARMGYFPRYLDGGELLERGLDREPGDSFGSVSGKDFTRQMLREPALLIDDVFTAAGAAWQVDWLARFLDQRHRQRRDQLTVLSTVWPPAKIRKGLPAQTADRLLSRGWLDLLELAGDRFPSLRAGRP